MNSSKTRVVIAIGMVALMALACELPSTGGVKQLKSGELQTQTISVPLPSDTNKPVDITLRLGAADVTVGSGATKLVEGSVEYNVPEFQPTITASGSQVEILQGLPGGVQGIPPKDMVNKWELAFSNKIPMKLAVQAGAYKGAWRLGGLRLQSLKWEEGASESTISFDQANPDKVDLFSFATGASTVKFESLANLNFAKMTFQGGVGTYTLDFGGKLRQSASVQVKTGVSDVTIVIPDGTAARVTVKSGVGNIKTVGSWSSAGTAYTMGDYESADAKLDIDLDIGVGQLTLEAR